MLTKKMTGRLGNQMFQYATIRAIQQKLYPEEKINLDFSEMYRIGKKSDGFSNQLVNFKIDKSDVVVNKKSQISVLQRVMLFKYYFERKIIKLFSSKESYEWKKRQYEKSIQKRYNKHGLYLFSYGFYKFGLSKCKNKLFVGFFESPRFFDDIRERLLEEFQPTQSPGVENNELYKAIDDSESVCITIRRGDFTEKRFARSANVCDEEYFTEGIQLMKRRLKNPRFFVFSDDISWVKNNMSFPDGTMFESGNDPVWEKLRLMYSCKHFILSNSSFSWWAQYLSRNEKKIVVAPSVWRKMGYDGRDLYDKGWKLIERE